MSDTLFSPIVKKIDIDKIIRSKRRTFGLRIGSDATLTVRAPMRASIRLIERVVSEKAVWITKKKEAARLRGNNVVRGVFRDGEIFYYLGNAYPLNIVDRESVKLSLNDGCFLLAQKDISNGREIFIKWYKAKALSYIGDRVDYYAGQNGLSYNRIRISSAKKRWGSCSSKGNLNFSWRLILATPDIIDYVVVHELAHLKHQNHATIFWEYVESILPDYKASKRWLKENGQLLTI